TGVIDPAGESLDTRDERSELGRIARRAAPRCAAVVREVRPGVAVAERAARSAAHRAAPRARDIVIGRRDDAQRIVRVDRDGGLVLRCRSGVLIHQDCGRRDGRPVEMAAATKPALSLKGTGIVFVGSRGADIKGPSRRGAGVYAWDTRHLSSYAVRPTAGSLRLRSAEIVPDGALLRYSLGPLQIERH